jgi:hypothetical protein
VGYLFASPVSNATIQAISQTGSWQEINSTQSATPVTKNVFTLYIDHGTAVNNASYSYIVVPGMTAASMDAYAAANPIQIIRNDANVQAVRQSSLGVTQAAFYAADSFSIATGQTVAASTPSTVMLEQQPDSLKISASTPAAKQITLQLTLTGVHISSSGSTWLDAMGTGIASLNLPSVLTETLRRWSVCPAMTERAHTLIPSRQRSPWPPIPLSRMMRLELLNSVIRSAVRPL